MIRFVTVPDPMDHVLDNHQAHKGGQSLIILILDEYSIFIYRVILQNSYFSCLARAPDG
jgi:hypothetical protein